MDLSESQLDSSVGDLASSNLFIDSDTTTEPRSMQDEASQSASATPAVPAACLACVSIYPALFTIFFPPPKWLLGVLHQTQHEKLRPVGFIGLTCDPHLSVMTAQQASEM